MTGTTWIAISAVASALVAVATGFLARYTYDLAKETRQSLEDERSARRAEEVRHMDGFMPHVALVPRQQKLHLAGPGLEQRFLALYARNVGAGFAHNIRVSQSNLPNGNLFFVFDPPIALGVGEEILLAARDASNQITEADPVWWTLSA